MKSAFLGLERRRDCGVVPYGGLFGEFFTIFGGFFAKSGLEFSKIEENGAGFHVFEKGAVVIALSGE